MRIIVPAITALALDPIDPERITPMANSDGTLRLIDGKPVYTLRNVVVRDADGNTVRASSVKVHTVPANPVAELTSLRCVDCRITPWIDGRQVALSVVADRVELPRVSADTEAEDE